MSLKQSLRKLEFPLCSKEALHKINELMFSGMATSMNKNIDIQNMDIALDLMAEFIFLEVDKRGEKRLQPLNPLVELQLVKTLYDYFDSVPCESARNTVFLSLFSGTTANSRIQVLSKLVSLAIGIPSTKILVSARVHIIAILFLDELMFSGMATSMNKNIDIQNMDIALDLMAEFIFLEVDKRGEKRLQPLNPLVELQLVKTLYDYFDSVPCESARNTVFLSLFSGTTANSRIQVLSKLVSLAIGIPSTKILVSARAWMQQIGNSSQNSCKLADAIVQDYFYFYKTNLDKITLLPKICPEFTANVITAITENYYNARMKEIVFPPDNLIETITKWVRYFCIY
uniref:Uncharacterized protein LOC114347511 n=1 Tax=Diabrotica virgifera virgifera TaxID=50390 RepID=A0A6P7GW77_DIAVI